MADLRLVSKAMFYKKDWDKISDEEKESCFFIFNRYFSKKYPKKAQILNSKKIDKVSAMNLWYHFMKDKPYPSWFWSKSETNKEKSKLSKKDYDILIEKLNIKKSDLDYLIDNNFEFIKNELKHYKNIEKEKNKK